MVAGAVASGACNDAWYTRDTFEDESVTVIFFGTNGRYHGLPPASTSTHGTTRDYWFDRDFSIPSKIDFIQRAFRCSQRCWEKEKPLFRGILPRYPRVRECARAFHLFTRAISISFSLSLSLPFRCEKYCLNCPSGNFVGSLTREPSRFIIHITHTNLSPWIMFSRTHLLRDPRDQSRTLKG